MSGLQNVNDIIGALAEEVVPWIKTAIGTANLTLTTTFALVPGMTLTLPTPGEWLVLFSVVYEGDALDTWGEAKLYVDGVQVASPEASHDLAGISASVATAATAFKQVITKPGAVIDVRARKASGSGGSRVLGARSALTASRVNLGGMQSQ